MNEQPLWRYFLVTFAVVAVALCAIAAAAALELGWSAVMSGAVGRYLPPTLVIATAATIREWWSRRSER